MITTKPGKASIDWRQGFAELSFIPVASDWIELLASRLAQPLMFVSSLYIIAETVTPGLAAWSPFFNFSTRTAMSLGPEIVLPGCFQQAQQARRDGKENKAGLLYALCTIFGVLTLLTFASFLWHFAGGIDNFILLVRCVSGVSYTIILKIEKEQSVLVAQPVQPAAQSLPAHEDLAALIAQSVENAVAPLRTELRSVQRFVQSQTVRIEEIAQSPNAIEIDTAHPAPRPAIAQKSMMRNDEEVEDYADEEEIEEETPIAQQETQPVEAVRKDSDVRSRVFAFLDAHYAANGLAARITNLEIEKGAPASKNMVVKYRREYDREKRGGV